MNNLDNEYISIVGHILENEEFIRLKKCLQHGTDRYSHSLKVSYKAYKIAKKYNFEYKEVAISGLLHDFFNNENATMYERMKATFTHPEIAEANAREKFNISEKEAKIIRCHMFPINLTIPRDKESWLVTYCDKVIGVKEFFCCLSNKLKYVSNIFVLILLNFIK